MFVCTWCPYILGKNSILLEKINNSKSVNQNLLLQIKFFMLALLRRASFWPPSMVYISVIIAHIHTNYISSWYPWYHTITMYEQHGSKGRRDYRMPSKVIIYLPNGKITITSWSIITPSLAWKVSWFRGETMCQFIAQLRIPFQTAIWTYISTIYQSSKLIIGIN